MVKYYQESFLIIRLSGFLKLVCAAVPRICEVGVQRYIWLQGLNYGSIGIALIEKLTFLHAALHIMKTHFAIYLFFGNNRFRSMCQKIIAYIVVIH